jgi:SagB-type dehydrogenase family enzyme
LSSTLLFFSIGETNDTFEDGVGQRVYPSAGALYPLEFYVLLFQDIEDLTLGVYHYDIVSHGLRKINNVDLGGEDISRMVGYRFAQKAKFAVIFTACFSRSTSKYGERAYRYILVEAGGVMQNFSLVASSLSIDSSSIGAVADDIVEPLLGIDGSSEAIVHSMFFG